MEQEREFPTEEAKKFADKLTDVVNPMAFNAEKVAHAMRYQHRTLQQSITRFSLAWLLEASRDDFQTDLRNEQTKKTAQYIIGLVRADLEKEGYKGKELEEMIKAKFYLSFI